ncbi:MAG: membrane dipeptidase [Gemmatimonadota bacterium]|nr:MAG: membrane dipeptidase [Gemmatimonadota bacterium]
MTTNRRDFLTKLSLAGVGIPALASGTNAGRGALTESPRSATEPSTPQQRAGGTHSVLEQDHPYIYIDSCMQIWPDADLAIAHRHGVTAYGLTAWDPHVDPATALEGAMYWHKVVEQFPNLVLIETTDDIRQAKRDGKAGLLLAAQGGDWIGRELHRVAAFQQLGLRMLLLAYNASNQLCDGCLDRTDGGLTRLGQMVVDECNRVGIVLDLTHTGRRATLEIIDRSAHPCVYSHSNPSAIVPSQRNIDDEQINACTERDGVIGLVSWGPLVMRPGTTHRPTLDEFIDLIDYVAQLTGSSDHIGISTDMSLGTYPFHESDPWGAPDYPDFTALYNRHVTADIRSPLRNVAGFSDFAEIVAVADRLLERGYSDDDVRRMLGGNLLRVFEAVWQ